MSTHESIIAAARADYDHTTRTLEAALRARLEVEKEAAARRLYAAIADALLAGESVAAIGRGLGISDYKATRRWIEKARASGAVEAAEIRAAEASTGADLGLWEERSAQPGIYEFTHPDLPGVTVEFRPDSGDIYLLSPGGGVEPVWYDRLPEGAKEIMSRRRK